MWPTALANLGIDLKGKITEGAEDGRAVGRLTDLGHGQMLRELFRPDSADGPVPKPLVDAVLEVLGDWHPAWPARPTGVAYVESARRPQLTRDLAEGLARYLKLPLVARWQIVDPDVQPGQGAANSAQRVAAVAQTLRPRRATSRSMADPCCWSMTSSRPDGPSPSRPAHYAQPERAPYSR